MHNINKRCVRRPIGQADLPSTLGSYDGLAGPGNGDVGQEAFAGDIAGERAR